MPAPVVAWNTEHGTKACTNPSFARERDLQIGIRARAAIGRVKAGAAAQGANIK